jgi:O-acetyl-ADP-ribose deacetylase (regulator of RNase III)
MNRTVKGDLLALFQAGHFDVIVHGCNCQATMGAGIAKQIAHVYPEVQEADRRLYQLCYPNPGSMLPVITKHGIVVNLYTQRTPGPCATLGAVERAAENLNAWLCAINIGHSLTIGIPWVGCGIGGLAWNDVKPLFEKKLSFHHLVFVDYEPQKIVKPPSLGPIFVNKENPIDVSAPIQWKEMTDRNIPVEFDPEEQWEIDDLHARQIITTKEADKLARDLHGGV